MLFIALFAKPPAHTPQPPLDCLENCCFIKFLIELKLSSPRGRKAEIGHIKIWMLIHIVFSDQQAYFDLLIHIYSA